MLGVTSKRFTIAPAIPPALLGNFPFKSFFHRVALSFIPYWFPLKDYWVSDSMFFIPTMYVCMYAAFRCSKSTLFLRNFVDIVKSNVVIVFIIKLSRIL